MITCYYYFQRGIAMNHFKIHKGNNNITYFSIPSFDETGLVKNCFTSRLGGVSNKAYDSLNLGLKTMDQRENVLKNYQLVCDALEIPMENLVCSDQVHGDKIKIITQKDRGKGITRDTNIMGIDGFVTNEKNVALVTVYADCVPIFILDPENEVIGVAHGGWKGTQLKIAGNVIKTMGDHFNTKPKNCLAAIGPSIGKCCYEVDKPVVDKFNENFTNSDRFVFSKGYDKYMLDLWEANKLVLEEMGVEQRNITISNLCTMCNGDLLYSHRRDHGQSGRMAAIMALI